MGFIPQQPINAHSANSISTQKLTRRTLLGNGVKAGVGATMLGPLLAACGEDASSSSRPNGPVTIQYAALNDQTGEQAAEIARFNDLHKGKIKVEYQQLPPVSTDQYGKFVSAFRAQSEVPDVVHIDVTWPAQFASSGWLEPLDRYASADYLKQFYPSASNVAKIDGKIYGIQRYLDIGLLYYRTDLVKKYGGQVPQTRADMEAMATKILAGEKSNGVQYGYVMQGKKIEAIVDEWLEFLWGAGGNIGNPGSLKVDDATSIDALQYMHDLIYSKKLSPTGTNTYAPNDALNLFNNGQAPFMRNWVFAYTLANNPKNSKVAGKVGIAPTLSLSGSKGQGCTGGWVLAINANSKYKDEAWAFIDFMLSKETQTSMAQNAGLVSTRPDVISDPALQSKHPQFKDLATILNGGHNRPQLKTYNQFTTPLQAAINGVLSNQQSAADALHGVQSQIASLA
ncbi:ABC transporter substrate-binding protein [Dictyobacter formicarum]|uniref:ABC transporter substrate-binding protein n=1 Tax=Dictyobacter formicarum TaxID=2778368 RepID=A0ABQ3VT23_9CHLR|nr:ABC transporter substrate-binding protein [Dictyobacter formicarum]GHO88466.1 ABC transporter substrate-binding protein [Dictyobacter formicarum]